MCSTTWRQRLVQVAGYGEEVLIVNVTKKFGSRTKKSEHALTGHDGMCLLKTQFDVLMS